MRSKLFLAFTLALAIPLAACGGDDDGGDDTITVGPDANTTPTPDAPDNTSACNPVEQTGCETDEKCAFVFDSFPNLGRTACAPAGTGALNDACTRDENTGVDDCGLGLQCLSGACREICSSAPDSCTTDYACSRYSAYFTDNDNVGVCDPTCNPIDQTRDYDSAELCGSANVNEPDRGCYGVSDRPFTCSPAGDPANVHNVDARDENGDVYINSCAPGYLPLLRRGSDDDTPICVAMCTPLETHSGATGNAIGESPYSCPDRNALTGNECRYFWWLEENPTVDRNFIGFCLNYNNYTYDDDGNAGTENVPFPSCTTLSNTDTDNNQTPDHLEWGCAPYPASLLSAGKVRLPRLADMGYTLAIPYEKAIEMYRQYIGQ